jgi:hypothetical protein
VPHLRLLVSKGAVHGTFCRAPRAGTGDTEPLGQPGRHGAGSLLDDHPLRTCSDRLYATYNPGGRDECCLRREPFLILDPIQDTANVEAAIVSRLLVEALNTVLEERAVELDHVERHLRRRPIRAHARDST